MAEDLLSPAEFAQRIKAQYPVYANVPDTELASRMLEKYPEYRDRVQTPHAAGSLASAGLFDPNKMSGNAMPGSLEFAKRAANALVDAPVGFAKLAARGVYAIPGVESSLESLWGVPQGSADKAAMPSNATQNVGGKAIALALGAKAVADLPAGQLPSVTRTSSILDESGNPITTTIAGQAQTVSSRAIELARQAIAGGKGPITAERVKELADSLGKGVVKYALGRAVYEKFKHLLD